MGLIPFFPGGANVTGNIAITMVLALCTFWQSICSEPKPIGRIFSGQTFHGG